MADLDAIVPDRPVFPPSADHHDARVNTKALEVSGIGADTPHPPDGWLMRGDDGKLEGTLREGAMALARARQYLHTVGSPADTTRCWGYAGIDDPTQAYLDLVSTGQLVSRVRGALWWDRHRGVEQVEELMARRAELAARGLDTGP